MSMIKTTTCAAAFVLLALGWIPASAQPPAADPPSTTAATSGEPETQERAPADAEDDDPDLDVNFAQPDFTLAALPTSLRLPKGKMALRITHRFARPLGEGSFGNLAEDLFGLDAGGLIGLELRYGIRRGTQVGINRTSDRTIQFFGQQEIRAQSESFPVGIALMLTADGTNNFRDSYSPGVGVVLSREIGRVGALYVEPIWVNNTNALPGELVDDNDTVIVGIGGRVRVRPTVYLVAEAAPRVWGFDPGATHASAAIEKRVGGHAFQLNFSNGFGTTMAQVARGGTARDDWYIGFNISRKFW